MTKAQAAPQQKQKIELKLLSELTSGLQGLLDSENFFHEIVNILQNKFNYYSIQIWSVNADASATLQARAGALDSSGEYLKIGQVLQPGKNMISYVIDTRKNYLVSNSLSVPLLKHLEVVQASEIIGVLHVESNDLTAFSENDVIALEMVASQIAFAMTNRQLYRDAKNFNKKLQQAVEEKTLELRRAHERILDQQKQLQRENKVLRTLVRQDLKSSEFIGNSSVVQNVLNMVDKVASTTATILILGESGTGKELIAKRLHLKSDRSQGPYVTINCGALQESLLESELFGHEKGSFTGAFVQKIGLGEIANGGTLFLDEIGELSLGIQAKLLRFLQESEFYRIGGKRPIKVNVRIVSATNRDLEREVREGRFREDLFYRLNTISLRMPPLRKRKEDIPALIEFFLKTARFGGPSQPIKRMDRQVIEVLSNYDWPGNIRELQNTIERLKILSDQNEIRLEDLPLGIRMPKVKNEPLEFTPEMTLAELEKNHVLRALAFHRGNKTKAAHYLGITIKTLYNKLHRYGILKELKHFPADTTDLKS